MKVGFAKAFDIPGILEIMDYWLNVTSKEKGFLFGVPFSEMELQRLIDNYAVVIAKKDNTVQGYFIVDEVTNNETTQMNKDLLDEVYSKEVFGYEKEDLIPRGSIAVSPKCQEMVSPDLIAFFKDNYQGIKNALFSIVSTENPNIDIHLQNGFEMVLEDERYYYVIFRL